MKETTRNKKSSVSWDIMPCGPLKVKQSFVRSLFHDWSPALLFNPEYGDDIFLRNIGRFSPDHMTLCPRRQNSAQTLLRELRVLKEQN
jgi:hypothetical protein